MLAAIKKAVGLEEDRDLPPDDPAGRRAWLDAHGKRFDERAREERRALEAKYPVPVEVPPIEYAARGTWLAERLARVDARAGEARLALERESAEVNGRAERERAELEAAAERKHNEASASLASEVARELDPIMLGWRSNPDRAVVQNLMRVLQRYTVRARAEIGRELDTWPVLRAIALALLNPDASDPEERLPHLEGSLVRFCVPNGGAAGSQVVNLAGALISASLERKLPVAENLMYSLESELLSVARNGPRATDEEWARFECWHSHLDPACRARVLEAHNEAANAERMRAEERHIASMRAEASQDVNDDEEDAEDAEDLEPAAAPEEHDPIFDPEPAPEPPPPPAAKSARRG